MIHCIPSHKVHLAALFIFCFMPVGSHVADAKAVAIDPNMDQTKTNSAISTLTPGDRLFVSSGKYSSITLDLTLKGTAGTTVPPLDGGSANTIGPFTDSSAAYDKGPQDGKVVIGASRARDNRSAATMMSGVVGRSCSLGSADSSMGGIGLLIMNSWPVMSTIREDLPC